MDSAEGPKKRLAEELEALRRQISELKEMVGEPAPESPPAGGSLGPAAGEDAVDRVQTAEIEVPLRQEAAKKKSRLPSAFSTGSFGLALLDSDYRILESNESVSRMLAYSGPELCALSLPSLIHPQDVGDCIRRIDQVLGGRRLWARFEKRLIRKDGEILWVQFTISATEGSPGGPADCLAVFEDITERRAGEQAGLRERRIYEQIFQNSLDGIFAFDPEFIVTIWNPRMREIFGLDKEEVVGRNLFDTLPFLTASGEDRNLVDVLRGGQVSSSGRPYHVPEKGKQGFVDCRYSPLLDESGKVAGGLALIHDITERKKAEEAALATEERYRDLFENANDIVYTHDMECRLTSINKAAERLIGYPRSEALKMKASQFVAPEHLAVGSKMMERQLAGETPAPFELEVMTRDGGRMALEINTQIIYREGKPVGVQGIARDVTERRKTEEALQQAKQNLEAWVHELEQRTREMSLLSEMGDMLRACLTTEEAYSVIVRVAKQIFPVQVGALYVLSPSRNTAEAAAVWGDPLLVERVFAPEECWALRRGRVHWVEDSATGLLCKHLPHPPPEGYLCVPMMAQSEALGILYLAQPEGGRLTEAKQRLAVAMAEHIAMALSNLRLHETLRTQSIRDPLTGLFNRRFMEESLELEIRRATRNRRPLGIITLEVDDFSAIGATLGKEAEEDVLQGFGGLIQTVIRKEDIASRPGDGKFTVVLPHGNVEVTGQRAESLAGMIRNFEVRHRGRSLGRFTASVGVAAFPDHGRTVEILIRAADAALQRARLEGGDRVVIAR